MKPAIGLFLLAPFVGEFLLGNLTLGELGLGVILAPMYGAGALLIREVTRRTGRGWPTMVLLAIAYALMEEGPIDQLLWNDSYAGHDMLHGDSFIPAIGMSVELTVAIVALHAVWSICVPIALIETLTPDRRTTPWLTTRGLVITAIVYVAGGILVFFGNYSEEHFIANPWQLGSVVLVIAALVVLAFRIKPSARAVPGRAPEPWVVGGLALLGTSVYWGPSTLITAGWYEWINVATFCVVALAGVVLIRRWSRQEGWDQRHVFALAAGATLTYVWTAFPTVPESGGSRSVDLIGNAVFGVVAVSILVIASRRVAPTSVGSGLPH